MTGACLMTRRALFDEVGGLSTMLPVNYNDVDYCLKLRTAGSGSSTTPIWSCTTSSPRAAPTEVEDWEKELLLERWGASTAVDPFANPNLHRGSPRLSSGLRWAVRRRPNLPKLLSRR